MKIIRRTSQCGNLRKNQSINAVRIFFPEIGGTKNRGRAPSGICNCKVVNWFGVTKAMELGRWTGFMTKDPESS